ncbi:hypothetical protein [Rhodococcus rhodnii]|uniref:hypothetical protein n=1 Tax=Rhodococcus rhodnii TaxID=38312 RepID=UPI000AD4498B|nr:hypothetical protein [Rhodococcus rhodnii]
MTEPRKFQKRAVAVEVMQMPYRYEGTDPSIDNHARRTRAAAVYAWIVRKTTTPSSASSSTSATATATHSTSGSP